jgi:hypothetical protein
MVSGQEGLQAEVAAREAAGPTEGAGASVQDARHDRHEDHDHQHRDRDAPAEDRGHRTASGTGSETVGAGTVRILIRGRLRDS